MALTTVKPSPACGICRSESSTSNFSVAIRWSASRTPTTATTSNPSRSSAVCNIWRTASSSSASKILSTFTAFSLPAEKCCTSGFPADYEISPTLSVQNCSAGDAQALTRLVPRWVQTAGFIEYNGGSELHSSSLKVCFAGLSDLTKSTLEVSWSSWLEFASKLRRSGPRLTTLNEGMTVEHQFFPGTSSAAKKALGRPQAAWNEGND